MSPNDVELLLSLKMADNMKLVINNLSGTLQIHLQNQIPIRHTVQSNSPRIQSNIRNQM